VVLTGPKTGRQLKENLDGLRGKGPLSEQEMGWIREFGQIVHRASSRFTFRF
jgi:predicted aldo/keto reductase-like oxidoreductase